MAQPEAPATAAPASLPAQLLGLLQELPGLFSDRVELLSLELQRATAVLAQIVVLVVAVGILGMTAWLALWFGVVAGLVALGLALGWSLLAVLFINLLSAWWAVARIRGLLPLVSLPATRRHLVGTPTAKVP